MRKKFRVSSFEFRVSSLKMEEFDGWEFEDGRKLQVGEVCGLGRWASEACPAEGFNSFSTEQKMPWPE
jgi:hypothetical protein